MQVSALGGQQYEEAIKLHYKKDRTMEDAYKETAIRKNDPALDQMLYDTDKAEMLGEISKVRDLLMKIARGESLSEEERKLLQEKYPDMEQAAQQAKSTAASVKDQLKSATSSQTKQGIIAQSSVLVAAAAENDSLYSGLLSEALQQAVQEVNGNKTPDQTVAKAANKYAQLGQANVMLNWRV